MDFAVGVKYGTALGFGVFLWQVISTATGQSGLFIPIATGLQAGLLFALFSRPAAGRPMGPRIATGALVSAIGAVAAFAGSLLTTEVLFPDALAAMGSGAPTALAAAGGGFLGTLVMGCALSAALVFVQRNRVTPGLPLG